MSAPGVRLSSATEFRIGVFRWCTDDTRPRLHVFPPGHPAPTWPSCRALTDQESEWQRDGKPSEILSALINSAGHRERWGFTDGQGGRHGRRGGGRRPDGASLAVGGFGLCGVPNVLIEALSRPGRRRPAAWCPTTAASTAAGSAILLAAGRIARVTGSYIGENKEFARQYLAGELEVELIPQGTLAERLRAGGAGIPAFYTPAGVGTQVADGGLPWRYAADGSVALASPPKEVREFDGAEYVLEHGITHRLRAGPGRAGATGTATWSSTSPPGTSTRSPRWPAGSRSPRSRSSSSPARSTRTQSTCRASSSSACGADPRAGRRQADREATVTTPEGEPDGLDPRRDGRPRRARAARRRSTSTSASACRR